MEGFSKKFTAVTLAAVLSFVLLVPVPIGNVAIDRGRFSQAHATAAIPAGWAIWGTAAALAGLYICATTDADYVTAVQQAYGDFLDAIGSDEATFTPLMLEYYNETDGTINFNAMYSELFGEDLTEFARSQIANGNYAFGEVSNPGNGSMLTLDGVNIAIKNGYPANMDKLMHDGGFRPPSEINSQYSFVGYYWSADGMKEVLAWSANLPVSCYPVQGQTTRWLQTSNNLWTWTCVYNPGSDLWSITSTQSTMSFPTNRSVVVDASVIQSSNEYGTVGSIPTGVSAVVSQVLEAGVSSIPAGTYSVYEPTTAQLEAGFDAAAVLQAINGAGGAISDDLTDLAGTLANMVGQMTGLADSVTALGTMVAQLVASNAALQTWAGSGSFDNVMNTVIDGLGDISGGIEAGVSDILDGLADIPGADVLSPSIDQILADIELLVDPVAVDIPGAIEGVLEGVLDIPGAIEVGAVNVVDAVNAMSLDIAGVIEGVMEPFMQQFRVPEGDGTPVAIPTGITEGLAVAFEDKVPFCYVIRSSAALQRMFANFSQSRSFYFDVTLPFTEETVTFDGEIFLSQPFGVSDIATTIKVILTALICFGLLWRSYKIIERAVL